MIVTAFLKVVDINNVVNADMLYKTLWPDQLYCPKYITTVPYGVYDALKSVIDNLFKTSTALQSVRVPEAGPSCPKLTYRRC